MSVYFPTVVGHVQRVYASVVCMLAWLDGWLVCVCWSTSSMLSSFVEVVFLVAGSGWCSCSAGVQMFPCFFILSLCVAARLRLLGIPLSSTSIYLE